MENQDKSSSSMWLYWVAGVAVLATIGVGAYMAAALGIWTVLAAGLGGLLVGLMVLPLAISAETQRQNLCSVQQRMLDQMQERFEQFSIALNTISEQQLLSDRAKSVAYRDKDREALRRAIAEEIARGDWEAALNLAADMESEFGYRQEADRFREDIANRRQEAIRRQIAEAAVVIDRHVRVEAWQLAAREVDRLTQQYPGEELVQRLPAELEARRQAVKQRLLDSWHDAQARHDVDGSIELVKKLDAYLTPQEAEGMKDAVRQVFEEKFNSLRNQFSVALHEGRTSDAIRIGEMIVRDFPNRRVAQEIRERMELLRQRAAGERAPEPARA